MIRTFIAIVAVIATALPTSAFETTATSAYVIDQTTGTVLLSKEAEIPLPPASMSKLMTLYMAFEALRRGKADGGLDLNEMLPVSEHAQSYGGSSMFLRSGEEVSVEDLVRGIVVQSGNDACVVIAEALSPDGTEYGFSRLMTQRAQEMGMEHSTFTNSNGWPQTGHRMSMKDLAILADRLITDFPEYYPLFAETEFAFDNRVPSNRLNRNPVSEHGDWCGRPEDRTHAGSRLRARGLGQAGRPPGDLRDLRAGDLRTARPGIPVDCQLGLPAVHHAQARQRRPAIRHR